MRRALGASSALSGRSQLRLVVKSATVLRRGGAFSAMDAERVNAREIVGRYALYDIIASGGMATVHYGRLLGPVGFARTVAVKKLHPALSRDAEFVSMLVDEARLAARIRHPNVVPTLDVVAKGRELYLVMEYVLGATLSELIRTTRRQNERIPPPIVASILSGCLHGLHAAHDTADDSGAPLGIVHRDVSPQNILVGRDGMARVLDFGIAKAARRMGFTRAGHVKGKVAYMAPEQLRGDHVTRQADVYAAAVTLWEALTGLRAFVGNSDEIMRAREEEGEHLPPPSDIDPALGAFDAVVVRGLEPELERRYPTAKAMAQGLELCAPLATHGEVADWLSELAWAAIEQRSAVLARIDRDASVTEVRAAMREELSIDGPTAGTANTTVESPSSSFQREETPTRVEPSSRNRPADSPEPKAMAAASTRSAAAFLAPSQEEPVIEVYTLDSDALSAPSDATTRAAPDDSHERTAAPVALDRGPLSAPAALPPQRFVFHMVIFGAAAALIVGGIMAFLVLHRPGQASTPSGTDAASPSAVASGRSHEEWVEPIEPVADESATSAARDQAPAPRPVPRSTSRPPKPRPTAKPKSGDIFDSLGGRH
jgi:serine/threonine-protein kinase